MAFLPNTSEAPQANKPEKEVNRALDQVEAYTKAQLDKLHNSPEQANVATNVLAAIQEGLAKDLDEAGITDPAKRKEYLDAITKAFNKKVAPLGNEAIAQSLEGAKLNAFVTDFAKEVKWEDVDGKDVKGIEGWVKSMAKDYPSLVTVAIPLLERFISEESKELDADGKPKKPGFFGRILAILKGEDGGKKPDEKPAQAPAAEAAPAIAKNEAGEPKEGESLVKPVSHETAEATKAYDAILERKQPKNVLALMKSAGPENPGDLFDDKSVPDNQYARRSAVMEYFVKVTKPAENKLGTLMDIGPDGVTFEKAQLSARFKAQERGGKYFAKADMQNAEEQEFDGTIDGFMTVIKEHPFAKEIETPANNV